MRAEAVGEEEEEGAFCLAGYLGDRPPQTLEEEELPPAPADDEDGAVKPGRDLMTRGSSSGVAPAWQPQPTIQAVEVWQEREDTEEEEEEERDIYGMRGRQRQQNEDVAAQLSRTQ